MTNNNDNLLTTAMRAASYGVREDMPLALADYTHESVDYAEGDVHLSDPRLVQVDRIRLLTDRGCPFMDLSYAYGTLRDGRHVRVDLGAHQFGRRTYKTELVQCAKDAGRYAKGLGMLDSDTISILWG